MIEPHHADRAELTEKDLAVAALVGRYIERREAGQPPCAHDLFAVAAEVGDIAVDALRTVLACYEAMRATGDHAPVTPQDNATHRTSMSSLTRRSSIRSGSLR